MYVWFDRLHALEVEAMSCYVVVVTPRQERATRGRWPHRWWEEEGPVGVSCHACIYAYTIQYNSMQNL